MSSRKEQLPLGTKVQIPEGALTLEDKLAEIQYPPTIVCPAGHILSLQEHRIEWRVGKHVFYLGPITGYWDDKCGITYLLTEVRDGVVSCINGELARIGERETFQLPQNLRVVG